MSNVQAGWYPDPSGDTTKLRWWDGTQWTDNYTSAQPSGTPASAQQPNFATNATVQPAAVMQPGAIYAMTDTDRTLRLIAFVLNVISAVASCWLIVPLAWMIPMTVRSWNIYKGVKPNTVAFGVCTLIFVNLVGGILLLVSKKEA